MERFFLISDDLTGACDSASYLCGDEGGVFVHIDSSNLDRSSVKNGKVLVCNTHTRTMNSEQAYKKVYRTGRKLSSYKDRTVVKKIDTAYRGNVAVELNALMDVLNMEFCFVVNAVPSMNRITVDGFQIIEGKILEQTAFSRDPVNAVNESYVPSILQSLSKREVGTVSLQSVRSGGIHAYLDEQIRKGKRIIVFDAVSESDIDIILKAFYEKYENAVWAGSLGLVSCLHRMLFPSGNKSQADYCLGNRKSESAGKRVVGFSASSHSITKMQVENACEKGCLSIYRVDIGSFLNHEDIDKELDRAAGQIRSELHKRGVFVIPDVDRELENANINRFILKVLSSIALRICTDEKTIPVILVGGDTAYSILNALNAGMLEISGRIEEAIAFGRVVDGMLSGRRLCLKGGSVGSKDAIINMANMMLGRS